MRLFIAICFDENMLDSLNEIQDDLTRSGVNALLRTWNGG